jgi:hypothetical protein
MKLASRCVMTILMLAVAVVAQTDGPDEHAVRQTVGSFYRRSRRTRSTTLRVLQRNGCKAVVANGPASAP